MKSFTVVAALIEIKQYLAEAGEVAATFRDG